MIVWIRRALREITVGNKRMTEAVMIDRRIIGLAVGYDSLQFLERRHARIAQNTVEINATIAGPVDQHLGAGTSHDIGNFSRTKPRIDRHHDAAQPCHGKKTHMPGRYVGQPYRDSVTLAHAKLVQALRYTPAFRLKRRSGHRLVTINQSNTTRRHPAREQFS